MQEVYPRENGDDLDDEDRSSCWILGVLELFAVTLWMHISCSHALLGQEPFPGRVADYDYGPGWDEDLSYARLDAFTAIFQNVRIPVWLVQVRRLKLYIYIVVVVVLLVCS